MGLFLSILQNNVQGFLFSALGKAYFQCSAGKSKRIPLQLLSFLSSTDCDAEKYVVWRSVRGQDENQEMWDLPYFVLWDLHFV